MLGKDTAQHNIIINSVNIDDLDIKDSLMLKTIISAYVDVISMGRPVNQDKVDVLKTTIDNIKMVKTEVTEMENIIDGFVKPIQKL
jgi:hypothetical protein